MQWLYQKRDDSQCDSCIDQATSRLTGVTTPDKDGSPGALCFDHGRARGAPDAARWLHALVGAGVNNQQAVTIEIVGGVRLRDCAKLGLE